MLNKNVQNNSNSLKQAAPRMADEALYDVDHGKLNEAVAEHLKQAFEATEARVRCCERTCDVAIAHLVLGV